MKIVEYSHSHVLEIDADSLTNAQEFLKKKWEDGELEVEGSRYEPILIDAKA